MIGLSGLEFTSSTGPKTSCTPTARASWPRTRPERVGERVGARGAERHHRREDGAAALRQELRGARRCPPCRIPGPFSMSEATSSGTLARRCSSFSLAA